MTRLLTLSMHKCNHEGENIKPASTTGGDRQHPELAVSVSDDNTYKYRLLNKALDQ